MTAQKAKTLKTLGAGYIGDHVADDVLFLMYVNPPEGDISFTMSRLAQDQEKTRIVIHCPMQLQDAMIKRVRSWWRRTKVEVVESFGGRSVPIVTLHVDVSIAQLGKAVEEIVRLMGQVMQGKMQEES
jgi:hypothetical protein